MQFYLITLLNIVTNAEHKDIRKVITHQNSKNQIRVKI